MKYINITADHEFKSILCGRLISRDFVHMERNVRMHVLIVVEEGVLNIEIDSVRYKVRKGEVVILPAELLHKGFRDSETDGEIKYFWAHFVIGNSFSVDDKRTGDFCLPLHFKLTDYARVHILYNQLLDVHKLTGARQKYCDFLFTALCYEIASQSEYEGVSGNKIVNRAIAWIELEIKSKLSLEIVAEQLGYNKRYLAKIFKENTGTTVNDFILEKKLTLAKQMLTASNESIAAVASELGYDDAGYFMRIFKKKEGVTCNEYRNAYSKMYLNME